ncbi:hypothetical protein N9D38_02340 [Rubripirellula sp.]|nr:hypothetical protein [Rubripirellula sp.]
MDARNDPVLSNLEIAVGYLLKDKYRQSIAAVTFYPEPHCSLNLLEVGQVPS